MIASINLNGVTQFDGIVHCGKEQTMSRYIDADAYERELRTSNIIHHYGEQIVDKIHSAPSIDIVRCKECKHWRAYETWSECERWTGDPYDTAKTNADDFCSYGERINE